MTCKTSLKQKAIKSQKTQEENAYSHEIPNSVSKSKQYE